VFGEGSIESTCSADWAANKGIDSNPMFAPISIAVESGRSAESISRRLSDSYIPWEQTALKILEPKGK
jgi:hypothetical protein